MLRAVLAVIAGVVAGFMGVLIADAISHAIYPLPEGFDYEDKDALTTFIKDAPLSTKIVVALGPVAGAFLGGWLSALIARHNKLAASLIVGAILLAATIANLLMLPVHPVWMWVVAVLCIVPVAYLGGRLVKHKI